MKNFTILSTVLLFFCVSGKSQTYFPFLQESKVWSDVYDFKPFVDSSYEAISTTSYKIEGNIILNNGRNYKRFYNSHSDPYLTGWDEGEYYYREDSGKVFRVSLFSPDVEELLYDFTMNAGDSIFYADAIYPDYAHVGFVDSIFIAGSFRKQIHFIYPPDIWVEGLGSMFRPFSPLLWYNEYPNSYELLCVSDTSGSIYQNPSYNSCFIDTVMTDITTSGQSVSAVKVFNNPMHDYSIIDPGNSPESFTAYSLFNSNGLLVRNEIINNHIFIIRRENLSSGVYVLKLFGGPEVVCKKIIVD
jgi:hypothetical protein